MRRILRASGVSAAHRIVNHTYRRIDNAYEPGATFAGSRRHHTESPAFDG